MNADTRFGPALLIPVRELDIGDEVLHGLTWDWPAPYNGAKRRAIVRARLEAKRRLLWEWAARSPLAQYVISGVTA